MEEGACIAKYTCLAEELYSQKHSATFKAIEAAR
jgi:hypothetical protein